MATRDIGSGEQIPPSRKAVNTTSGPPYSQVRFRRLRLPRHALETRPPQKRLRRHLLPQVQTQNQTDDIFLAQILGHKLLGPKPPSP
jgi:hypothetical protein